MELVLVKVVDAANGKDATCSLLDDGVVVGVASRESLKLLHVELNQGLHFENELRVQVDQLCEPIG